MASARVHPRQPPKTARRPLLPTRRNPNAAATPRTTGVRDVARQPVSGLGPATAQAPALALQSSSLLTSRQQQMQWFGSPDQAVEPPDTQLAVGPYNLLEMINSSGSIWSKGSSAQFQAPPQAEVDLNVFYGVDTTPYVISDPRVQYDLFTGRWFASAVAFVPTTFSSQVLLAVSDTFDPAGSWNLYPIGPTTSSTLEDQPSLGVSTDKIVLSWNDFSTSTSFAGEETWVIQKSAVLAGQAPSEVQFGPDAQRASLIVAQQESPTATAFLAYNGSPIRPAAPYAGVVALTGTPAQGPVIWHEVDLTIVGTSLPPGAQQPATPPPGPASPLIATNDDRFMSVAWQNDVLWVAGNDACLPAGDTVARACVRLIKVRTSGTVALQTDADLALGGGYTYFPAVAMDSGGNMIVVFSQSSTSQFASLQASGDLAGDVANPPALLAETQVMAGQGVYNCNGCGAGANGDRWGDYSAAALEPCGSSAVWVAGEFMGDPSIRSDWGTAVGSLRVPGTPPPPFQACLPEDHGGILAGGVAASTWGPKRLDAFVRGTDGILYHRFVGDFSEWQWDPYLPQIHVSSDASVVSTGTQSIDVFVRGVDGALWRTTYRAGTSSGLWERLGGVLANGTAPSAVALSNGDIDVFVEGADRQLWDDRYTSATNSWTWTPRGGVLATTPSAVTPGAGIADAFVEGTDTALWLWSSAPSPHWTGLGGRLAVPPAAASSASGTVDALVEGTDSILYHWSSGVPGAAGATPNPFWEAVGGRLAAPPAATSWGGGRLDVLVRGTDSALWHAWTATGRAPWSWEGNGIKLLGAPAAVTYGNNRLDVFAHGMGNQLVHLPFD